MKLLHLASLLLVTIILLGQSHQNFDLRNRRDWAVFKFPSG